MNMEYEESFGRLRMLRELEDSDNLLTLLHNELEENLQYNNQKLGRNCLANMKQFSAVDIELNK